MGPNVKPLTHWVIYRGYKVRFTGRSSELVSGVLTITDGSTCPFHYDPETMTVRLPHERIVINAYGWEVERSHEE